MNIAFRVDASQNIGIGHLMRCLALSQELIQRNHICYFLTKVNDDILIDTIKQNNIIYQRIEAAATLKEELDFVINFSYENNINWIVTDHYDLDTWYTKKIKENNFKLLSVDDLAQIHYYSDIVVNQNIGLEKIRFSSEKYTKFLIGPKYVMMRNELLRRDEKKKENNVEKLLLTLGGSDSDNVTLEVLKSLETLDEHIEIILVVGPLNPFYYEIKRFVKNVDLKVKLIKSPKKMTDIYLESDIAISAGGTSCYELSYFGIPNIIIIIEKNQLNIAKEFDKQGISIYIGDKKELKTEQIKEKVKELINNQSLRKRMSQNGQKLIDGLGKKRIVDFMESYN